MKRTDNTELFETTPVRRAVLALVVPTVISQLITVFYNMADTFYIGQLNDPPQVAAATLSMPVFMFLTGIANLFGIGGASLIARSLGAGDREKAKHTASFCIWSAFTVALAYGFLLFALRPFVLPILGTNADTYHYSYQYIFWTVTVGAVPTVMNGELSHLVRSEGYSKQASFGVAFGGILNMILDPILIFGFHLELEGAAIATMLSNVAAALYFIILLARRRQDTVILPRPRYFTLGRHIPAEVVTVGLASFIMLLMSTVSNTVLNNLVSAYSNEAIAGMGIAKKIDMVAFALGQGMTQGALPLIAYNFTSGNRRRMTDAVKVTVLYALGTAIAASLVLIFAAEPVTKLFIDNAETVAHGQVFLKIIALACPATALNCMIITVFQATGKKVQPLFLSMLRKGVIDVPLMFLFRGHLGVNGIAWATPIADFIGLAVAFSIFIPYLRALYRKERTL